MFNDVDIYLLIYFYEVSRKTVDRRHIYSEIKIVNIVDVMVC